MALNKNHQAHLDMQNAFDSADKNTPRNALGNASYGMAKSSGLPRTPAQMASVKKAALKSAASRGEAALARSPKAPVTPGPAATAGGKLMQPPGVSTGGLAIAKPKKGLLSL